MKTKDFEKIASDLLKSISLTKRKYIFVRQLDNDSLGTVGFIIASHQVPGTLLISPIIGFFYKPIEELYCKLTGYDSVRTYQPTISTPIGYLTPSNYYKEWEYSDNNINALNSDMLDAIKTYGLPFMEKYKNQDELLSCLEERKYILHEGRDYKLPILYYLRGEKEKGLKLIETSVERMMKPLNEADVVKFDGVKSQLIIKGYSSYGEVEPRYLQFWEKYKAL